jgi:hypothetical protein
MSGGGGPFGEDPRRGRVATDEPYREREREGSRTGLIPREADALLRVVGCVLLLASSFEKEGERAAGRIPGAMKLIDALLAHLENPPQETPSALARAGSPVALADSAHGAEMVNPSMAHMVPPRTQ